MRERLFANIKPGGTLVLQGYTPKQLHPQTGGDHAPSKVIAFFQVNEKDTKWAYEIGDYALSFSVFAPSTGDSLIPTPAKVRARQ
jgi:hypothetical protein